MRLTVYLCLIVSFCLSLTACYRDNEEDLYGITNCDTTTVNYAKVDAILKQNIANCAGAGCHLGSNPAGGIALTNYAQVKEATLNGDLLKAVRQENGFPAMPPTGQKLSPCDITLLEVWAQRGAPEN